MTKYHIAGKEVTEMSLLQSKKIVNQTYVKAYASADVTKYKFVTLKVMHNSSYQREEKESVKRCSVNTAKLDNNVSRTRSTIFELAYCNQWQWFFTGTIDGEKYDRTDLDKYHKDFAQWLRDYKKKYGKLMSIKYLLVPELHSDGKSWHIHGLLSCRCLGLHLSRFELGDTMGRNLAEKVKRGDEVYNWTAYQRKFGFCSLERVRSHEAVAKYMTKYISKSLGSSVTELNAHSYYCSRGLRRAVMVKRGYMTAELKPDFVNDYCCISWVDDEEQAQFLIDSIL